MHRRYHSLSNTTKGILWMLAHCIVLVLIMGLVRELTNQGYTNYFIIGYQNLFTFLMVVPYCMATSTTGGGMFPHTDKIHLHIGRAFSGTTSGLFLFYGLSKIDLNTATAITFTGPLFTTIFAIIFLREKTYLHRIMGLSIGFIGVLVVLRPGTDAFDPNALFLVLTAALWGCTDMFIKLMNRTETIKTMMFYRVVLMAILTTPFLYFFHQEITRTALGLIFLLALTDLANFGTVIKAYRYADISILMPFDFSRLVFGSIFAFMMFGETLDIWVFIGSAIIVYGTVFVVYKEKKRSKLMSVSST